MAITEILTGFWTAVKAQPRVEKTKADYTIPVREFIGTLERLAGQRKILLRCYQANGPGTYQSGSVDGVRGNYLVLFTKDDSSYRFVELSSITKFDLSQNFEALKANYYYEVRN